MLLIAIRRIAIALRRSTRSSHVISQKQNGMPVTQNQELSRELSRKLRETGFGSDYNLFEVLGQRERSKKRAGDDRKERKSIGSTGLEDLVQTTGTGTGLEQRNKFKG